MLTVHVKDLTQVRDHVVRRRFLAIHGEVAAPALQGVLDPAEPAEGQLAGQDPVVGGHRPGQFEGMNAVPNALEGTGHQVQQDAVGVAQLIVIQAEQATGDGGRTEGIGGAAHLEAGIEAESVEKAAESTDG